MINEVHIFVTLFPKTELFKLQAEKYKIIFTLNYFYQFFTRMSSSQLSEHVRLLVSRIFYSVCTAKNNMV